MLVDTSVWSLALRRDRAHDSPQVARLSEALASRQPLFTTGLIVQELLQGFSGPKARAAIIERFAALPLVAPDRDDHMAAAEVRNVCRRKGVQLGTIDALLVQLCVRHELVLLSTDADFRLASRHVTFQLWA